VTPEVTGFLLSAAAASAAMLGWALVAAKRTWTDRSVGWALLFSAIAMLAISVIELLPPGLRDPDTRTATMWLFAAGFVAVPILGIALSRLLPSLGSAQSTAVLVMLAIALHNIPEGAVPLAATMVSLSAGVITAVAIALHNIPEGMAVSTAVLAMGGSRRRAFVYTGFSVIGEIGGAVLLLAVGRGLSPSGAAGLLSFVAGVMVSLCITQLIPGGVALLRGSTRITDHLVATDTPATSTW
jgi:ZIP family zinc transporter